MARQEEVREVSAFLGNRPGSAKCALRPGLPRDRNESQGPNPLILHTGRLRLREVCRQRTGFGVKAHLVPPIPPFVRPTGSSTASHHGQEVPDPIFRVVLPLVISVYAAAFSTRMKPQSLAQTTGRALPTPSQRPHLGHPGLLQQCFVCASPAQKPTPAPGFLQGSPAGRGEEFLSNLSPLTPTSTLLYSPDLLLPAKSLLPYVSAVLEHSPETPSPPNSYPSRASLSIPPGRGHQLPSPHCGKRWRLVGSWGAHASAVRVLTRKLEHPSPCRVVCSSSGKTHTTSNTGGLLSELSVHPARPPRTARPPPLPLQGHRPAGTRTQARTAMSWLLFSGAAGLGGRAQTRLDPATRWGRGS